MPISVELPSPLDPPVLLSPVVVVLFPLSVVFPPPFVGVTVPGDDADGVDDGVGDGTEEGPEEGMKEGTKEGDEENTEEGDEEGGTTGADVGPLVGALVGAFDDGAVVDGLDEVDAKVVGASVTSTGANVGNAVGPPPLPCDVGIAAGDSVKLSASHPYCPGVANVH